MKTASLLLSGLLLLQSASFAQGSKTTRSSQRETIVLNRNSTGTTTIEINENGVYLNGEQIATRSELNNQNLNKRIVIRDRSNNNTEVRDYDEYYNSGRRSNTGRRAMLGVFTDARRTGDGAYIERVTPNSAAERAGLRPGDVITKVDTTNVYTAEDLTQVIRNYRPGDKVTIAYNRNGKDRQTTATLGEARDAAWPELYDDLMVDPAPPVWPRNFPSDGNAADENRPRLGVTVDDDNNGVKIITVRPGSPADIAGLRAGDVITYVNDERISSVAELQRMTGSVDFGSRLKVEVERNGSRLTRNVYFPRRQNPQDL